MAFRLLINSSKAQSLTDNNSHHFTRFFGRLPVEKIGPLRIVVEKGYMGLFVGEAHKQPHI
jgi:hypothetical protein